MILLRIWAAVLYANSWRLKNHKSLSLTTTVAQTMKKSAQLRLDAFLERLTLYVSFMVGLAPRHDLDVCSMKWQISVNPLESRQHTMLRLRHANLSCWFCHYYSKDLA